MDIFSHLKNEHDVIRDLLEQIAGAEDSPEEREELLARLREELLTHAKGEEETFYQELQQRGALTLLIREALEDHTVIEELLDELDVISVHDAEWPERMAVLRDAIESHLDEEESAIFEKAKAIFSEGDSERLFSRCRTAEEHFRASA